MGEMGGHGRHGCVCKQNEGKGVRLAWLMEHSIFKVLAGKVASKAPSDLPHFYLRAFASLFPHASGGAPPPFPGPNMAPPCAA